MGANRQGQSLAAWYQENGLEFLEIEKRNCGFRCLPFARRLLQIDCQNLSE